MNPPFVRSPYNYDLAQASDEAAYVETLPSLTVQSMSEDADLNVLMKRFGVTGHMPLDARLPAYGDFTHITDYQSALEAIRSAESSFLEFPPDIRALFNNNPQMFLDFVENPANIQQVQKWFPKENLSARSAVGGSSSQGSPPNEARGAGAPASDGGAAVSQRSAESGGRQSG